MQNSNASFVNLDLGTTKPTTVPMETIDVVINGDLISQYGTAFVSEARRVNPLKAEQVGLTAEEVDAYSRYLVTKRIESIHGTCDDFRKLKTLYIPVWIQYNLAMIGRVVMRDRGLTINPIDGEPSTMTFAEAIRISEKIGAFEDDLQIVQDGMPRDPGGDKDVMSTALIADYVRSLTPVTHVASTYVTAFMGMRLKEEAAMAVLYRVQYDDVQYIATALTSQRGLY